MALPKQAEIPIGHEPDPVSGEYAAGHGLHAGGLNVHRCESVLFKQMIAELTDAGVGLHPEHGKGGEVRDG